MTRKPESIFADRVIADLKKYFGTDIQINNIQQVGINGTPDYLICLKGRFIALELKIDSGRVSPLQVKKLIDIKKSGGHSYIVYPKNWSKVFKELKLI